MTGEPLVEVNASHFTPRTCPPAVRHDYQLTRATRSCAGHTGRWAVGGDDSWGAHTHDEFKLFADHDYAYTYRLRPAHRRGPGARLSRRPTAVE
ncbi:hypothetical protein GCM10019016_083720 [Streptomyces prasinosporus]|uniref:Beta galactosidase small chain/ domain-containing protein n=1 Tax=Streptomyces prasinosporus TaxID=68256 RepID=A0ABP6U0W5_9ACTN